MVVREAITLSVRISYHHPMADSRRSLSVIALLIIIRHRENIVRARTIPLDFHADSQRRAGRGCVLGLLGRLRIRRFVRRPRSSIRKAAGSRFLYIRGCV